MAGALGLLHGGRGTPHIHYMHTRVRGTGQVRHDDLGASFLPGPYGVAGTKPGQGKWNGLESELAQRPTELTLPGVCQGDP